MSSPYSALASRFGAVSTQFLAQPVECLDPMPPITMDESTPLRAVLQTMQENHIGIVLITKEDGSLSGVFSERDVLMKVLPQSPDLDATSVAEFMTRDPKTQPSEATVAFVMREMVHGGFRHVPIVDKEGIPLGIVSVRDIISFIDGEIVRQLAVSELGSKE